MTTPTRNYKKTFEELEEVASKFWPSELSEMEAELSTIPLLLKTQDQFIHILSIETDELEKLFEIVEASSLPANLFLKHLVILADFGGEMLKRVSREFSTLFPDGELSYLWQGHSRSYRFKAVPAQRFSNTSLRIDGKKLFHKHPLSNLQRDAIALLLFGSAYSESHPGIASVLAKCELGGYLGKSAELATFIKQRYIWVSRVTGGAQSNSLGQLAQTFVATYLEEHLDLPGVRIQANGRLPGVRHTENVDGGLTTFDLVVTNGERYVAVEVCFQVTTNSVIERKAGQARSRYEQIQAAGHRIAYVLDGSGNFERESALRILCAYSHCTVAFSKSELDVLREYIQSYLSEGTA